MSKNWNVLLDEDGNMLEYTEKSRWGRYQISSTKVKTLPSDTTVRLNLTLKNVGYHGWWVCEDPDGKRFRLAASEIAKVVLENTISFGKFKGLFGFTRKGTKQSLKWLGKTDETSSEVS